MTDSTCLLCREQVTSLTNLTQSMCCLQPVCADCYHDWIETKPALICDYCNDVIDLTQSDDNPLSLTLTLPIKTALRNLATSLVTNLNHQVDGWQFHLAVCNNHLAALTNNLVEVRDQLDFLTWSNQINSTTTKLLSQAIIVHGSANNKTYSAIANQLRFKLTQLNKRLAWLGAWLASGPASTLIIALDQWAKLEDSLTIPQYQKQYLWRHPNSDVLTVLDSTQGWQLLPKAGIKTLPANYTGMKNPQVVKVVTISDGSDVIIVNTTSKTATVFFDWESLGAPAGRGVDIPAVLWVAAYQYGLVCLHRGTAPGSSFTAVGNDGQHLNYYAVYQLFGLGDNQGSRLKLVSYIDTLQSTATTRLVHDNVLYHFGKEISRVDLLPAVVTPAPFSILPKKNGLTRLTVIAKIANKLEQAFLVDRRQHLAYFESRGGNFEAPIETFDLEKGCFLPRGQAEIPPALPLGGLELKRHYDLPGRSVVEDNEFVKRNGAILSVSLDLRGNLYCAYGENGYGWEEVD